MYGLCFIVGVLAAISQCWYFYIPDAKKPDNPIVRKVGSNRLRVRVFVIHQFLQFRVKALKTVFGED